MLASMLKPQVAHKKKSKLLSFSNNAKISSSGQIEQKMQKLKQILQKQNLTHRTNKTSSLSSGSVISRKNRNKNTGPTYYHLTKIHSENSKQKQKQTHFISKYTQQPVKKVSSSSRVQSHLKSKLAEGIELSPNQKSKKKSKKIFSYIDSSYELEQLQKRIQKFKPTKSNQKSKLFKDAQIFQNVFVDQFQPCENSEKDIIQSFDQLQDNQQTKRYRKVVTQLQPSTKINHYDKQNIDISSQLIQNYPQSNSFTNTQKFSLLNTQSFSINQPSELNSYLLPLQSKHTTRNLNDDRRNISCLSNLSNFSCSYLKPIHEEDVWKNKLLHGKQHKEKSKSKQKNKNKPMMSFSLLLSRRNNNKKTTVNFNDHTKYESWLKIRKSSIHKKDNNSNYIKNLNKSGSRESSKRKQSLSTLTKKRKGRSLSSCFKNKQKESVKKSKNTQSDTKNNRQSQMAQSSLNMGKKTFKQLKQENRLQKHIEKSLILGKSKSSTNYLSKFNGSKIKTTRKGEQQCSDNQTERKNAIKQLHRKYQIEQLSLRLKQQLKKISSAIKDSSVNNTGRKTISNSKQSSAKLIKNHRSSKKSSKELSEAKQNRELYQKAIELKLKLQQEDINKESLKKHQGFSVKSEEFLQFNERQLSQKLELEQQDHEQEQVFASREHFSPSFKNQQDLNNEVILIEQDEFESPPTSKLHDSPQNFKRYHTQQVEASLFIPASQNNQFSQSTQTGKGECQKIKLDSVVTLQLSQTYEQKSFQSAPIVANPLAKKFPIDIQKPQQTFYNDCQNQFIFKNSSYEQFIQIYSSLLIEVAHRTTSKYTSELIHNLTRPLGTSTSNILKMMAQNHRQFRNTSSILFNSVNQQHKDGIDESQTVNESNDSILKESMLLQSVKKTIGKQPQQLESVYQQNQQIPHQEQQQEQQNEHIPEYIISPEIYYEVESTIINYLISYHSKSFVEDENIDPNIVCLNEFKQMISLVIKIHQNANQSHNNFQQISEFYEQYLKDYSLAVYDLSNTILDELRPYGTKGLPPINFFHQQNYLPKNIQEVKQFVSQKLTKQVFAIKLGLIVENIECQKPQLNKIPQISKGTQNLLNEQDQNIKAEKLTKVIKKYLQREAKLINQQLQAEYNYLQDVKFQILYDVWTQIESHILEQETQLLTDLIF